MKKEHNGKKRSESRMQRAVISRQLAVAGKVSGIRFQEPGKQGKE